MAHVHLHLTDSGVGSFLKVDGVDITRAVVGGSIKVEISDLPNTPSLLRLELFADELDLELPASVEIARVVA